MSWEMIIVIGVLILAVLLFVTEKLRVDLVALLVMALLLLSGTITPSQGLAGFSNSATVTVGAMFVISVGLYRAGAVNFLAGFVSTVFDRGFWFGLVAVMIVVGVLSAFINNTPVIAIFLPILLGVAREKKFSASKLLMPVSFASIFGGVCTLIGTSTNILVSSIAEKNGLPAFSMFEFAPLGAIMFAIGMVYLLIVGIRMIPDRRGGGDLVEEFDMSEYLTEIILSPNARSVNQQIKDAPLVKDIDVVILSIRRGNEIVQMPSPEEVLRPNDVLLIRCNIENFRHLQEREHVQFVPTAKWGDENVAKDNFRLVEAIIEPNSNLAGSSLRSSSFRDRFEATVLAIRHQGRLLRESLSDTTLSAGDVLLIEIRKDRINALRRSGEFIVTSEREVLEYRKGKAVIAIAIVATVIIAASINIAPIVVTALIGAIALVLTGCITLEEAYQAIEWKIIFLLAGVLSLGVALEQTGVARVISSSMITYVGGFGLIALVSAFYLLTSLLTETMSNNATAALLAPIAIATASSLEVSAMPFLMAITFAASASFMTPVGYQTNTMIYGPGQYRFTDFVKVGGPLNLIFWIVATLLIPMIWSF